MLASAAVRVLDHPVVAANRYLERFARGVNLAQARHELQQFSVFALQFDVALARLVANAPTKESYEERLRILLNEKGIPYQSGFDGELTGRWSPEQVHFSWLERMGEGLGLRFEDLGAMSVGRDETVQLVELVFDRFANLDPNIASGAAFAIENWAANALWVPWISGMEVLNSRLEQPVDLGYLRYHLAEEEHHSRSTLVELLSNMQQPWFSADRFFAGAEAVLTHGLGEYYEAQLASLPDKEDDDWPERALG